jgi:hypothetical protein
MDHKAISRKTGQGEQLPFILRFLPLSLTFSPR